MGDYDQIAEQYKKYGEQATTDWELGHKTVAKLIGPIKGKNILDYGCGNGKFSIYLDRLGARVVGIDISDSQLEVAKRDNLGSVAYLLDNDPVIEENYLDYFDSAVLIFVLCEISSKEKIISILRRINKLLKKEGGLVILNPNWDKSNGKDFMTHQMVFTQNLRPGCKVTTLLKGETPIHIPDFYWPKNNYLEMLTEAGFNNFEIFEPLALQDGTDWKDEKEFPPYLIISSRKI